MVIRYIAFAMVLALLGCGSADQGPATGAAIWGNLKSRLDGQGSVVPQPVPVITRAAFAGVTDPLILVGVPSRNALAGIVQTQVSGNVVTWVAPDGISLSSLDGIFTASRGFGPDLMSAQMPGLTDALLGGSGQITRAMQFLDGEDRTQTLHFECNVSLMASEQIEIVEHTHMTRRLREECKGDWGTFTNMYWLKGNVIWQSNQWMGPELGPIVVQKVI